MKQKIIVEYVYPPIGVRSFDWQATFDGYEPGDPLGRGPTEEDAVADLLEQAEVEQDYFDELNLGYSRDRI